MLTMTPQAPVVEEYLAEDELDAQLVVPSCCRQCAMEAYLAAGVEVPQELMDEQEAYLASPIGKWMEASAQAFVERHLGQPELAR